jgi:uroporphyrinogen-III synthase
MAYLNTRSVEVEPVSPYVYADDADDGKVRDLILALSDGSVDMIAFTSKTQVERLFRVANRYDFVSPLTRGLQATTVVAVGPVVERYLEERDIVVSLVPDERYFMKPMVQKIVDVVRDKNLA